MFSWRELIVCVIVGNRNWSRHLVRGAISILEQTQVITAPGDFATLCILLLYQDLDSITIRESFRILIRNTWPMFFGFVHIYFSPTTISMPICSTIYPVTTSCEAHWGNRRQVLRDPFSHKTMNTDILQTKSILDLCALRSSSVPNLGTLSSIAYYMTEEDNDWLTFGFHFTSLFFCRSLQLSPYLF